jgi:hypothetical protein
MDYFDYASLETNWAITAFVLNSDICIGTTALWRNIDKVWRVAMGHLLLLILRELEEKHAVHCLNYTEGFI